MVLMYLKCKDNQLVDLVENPWYKTAWINTALIVDGGVYGDQCLYFPKTETVQHYLVCDVDGSVLNTTDFTISFYFKIKNLSNANEYQKLVSILNLDGKLLETQFGHWSSGSNIGSNIKNTTNAATSQNWFWPSNMTLNNQSDSNVWHRFILTRNKNMFYLYLDKSMVASRDYGQNFNFNFSSNCKLCIGKSIDDSGNSIQQICDGYIDKVYISTTAYDFNPVNKIINNVKLED